jgi:hypothetical protein
VFAPKPIPSGSINILFEHGEARLVTSKIEPISPAIKLIHEHISAGHGCLRLIYMLFQNFGIKAMFEVHEIIVFGLVEDIEVHERLQYWVVPDHFPRLIAVIWVYSILSGL